MIVVGCFAGLTRSHTLAAAAAAVLLQSSCVSILLSELWQSRQPICSRPRLTGEWHLLLPLLPQLQAPPLVSLHRVRLCQRHSGGRTRRATRGLFTLPTRVWLSTLPAAKNSHCRPTLPMLARLLTPSRPTPRLQFPSPSTTPSQSAPHPHPGLLTAQCLLLSPSAAARMCHGQLLL